MRRKSLIVSLLLCSLLVLSVNVVFKPFKPVVKAATAVYYLGYTTAGGSYGTESTIDNTMRGSVFTCTQTGTVKNMSVYFYVPDADYGANRLVLGIYFHSNGSKVGQTVADSVGGSQGSHWRTLEMDGTVTVYAGVEYVLVVNTDIGSAKLHYDSGSSNQGHYQSQAYSNTLPSSASFSHDDNKYSIYATVEYTVPTNLNLRTVDHNNNVVNTTTVYMNNGTEYSKTVDSNGWANWTGITADSVSVKVKYQGLWVNGSFTVQMNTNKTIDVVCNIYNLTVYVTDENNEEKSGATVVLERNDGANLTSYGITTSKTASYYNSTHAKCIWTFLANYTYNVTATFSGQSKTGSTQLTSDKTLELTIPGGTTGGSSGGSSGPSGGDGVSEPGDSGIVPPVPEPPGLPEKIRDLLPWITIAVTIGIIAVPTLTYSQLKKERKKRFFKKRKIKKLKKRRRKK